MRLVAQQSAGIDRRRVNAAASAVGPGPVAVELELGAAAVADDLAGDVQQPVAQPFGFGVGELAVKADQLRPGEQVLGDQRELEPGLVVLEGVVREVAHAGVLAGADPVLDPGAAAVAQLQRRRCPCRPGR